MKLKQLSIFVEDKSSRLDDVTKLLGENGINIRAISLADTSDFGILRIIVNDVKKAFNILKEAHFTVSETEVLAVEVPDVPGGLHSIMEVFCRENISVEYIYSFFEKITDKAILAIRFEDVEKATEVLQKNNISVLSREQVHIQ